MGWHVIADRYTDQWKLLPLGVGEQGKGIAVFEFSFQARQFVEANWETLGPGWVPLELNTDQLVYVLELHADAGEAQWVIRGVPTVKIEPNTVTQEAKFADIREFIAVMKEKDE
jgi:hypothetical protein